MIDQNIKIRNYKCFANNPQGFDKIFPINIIIGKNNSGKSTLIDLVDFCTNWDRAKNLRGNLNLNFEIIYESRIVETDIRRFDASLSGGGIPGANHREYGLTLIGQPIKYALDFDSLRIRILNPEGLLVENAMRYLDSIQEFITPPLKGKNFQRIAAERDIVPEPASGQTIQIQPNGVRATDLFRQILHKQEFDRKIIERDLFEALKKIIEPDIIFTDIAVREASNSAWEILFEHDNDYLIPLSKMGSGLKTILLVLTNLLVLPKVKNLNPDSFVFGFEELENNLHPSMLRRLFQYIKEYSEMHNTCFFITTHSSIVIDLFSGNSNAQLLHVQNIEGDASITPIDSSGSARRVLKDMDFRASDLLLTNGVIWVEGPSDAIYIELFLDLYRISIDDNDNSRFNYSIQSLATALWKYAGFEDMDWSRVGIDQQNTIINLEKMNHNHLLVIDNDRNYEDRPPSEWSSFVNGTGQNKARLIHESMKFAHHNESDLETNFGDAGEKLFFWINEGTMESYLEYFIRNRGNSFSEYFDLDNSRGYFEKLRRGDKSSISKVVLAGKIAQFCFENSIEFENLAPAGSALRDKIRKMHNTIKTWNSM